ncbi:AI-2E family transporter [Anaeromicropila populeti]|uniref:Predicted PurR-regulated permease PerM n=1 Tax=Anaeromicropila populeti TaxID=37658 RepID=A0A1I6JCY0_9FIRM|nr:AI-2E family transporter [Anaeromicropila populeti]SFR76826.1 Predicted PurR-regulated permease PerM [Anaeromicropila populeti]
MKDYALKKKMILVTYAFALLFVVVKFDLVCAVYENVMGILSPFFLGVVLAFILNKPMQLFERLYGKIMKRRSLIKGLSLATAYIAFFLVISMIIVFIVPQLTTNIKAFVESSGDYISRLEIWALDIAERFNLETLDLSNLFLELNDIIKNLASWVINYIGTILPTVISVTTNVFSMLFKSIITIVFSINLLAGKDRLLNQIHVLHKTYLPEKWSKRCEKIGVLIPDIFGKYLVGQVTEACILGALCFIGMNIFQFDYAVLISTLIAVTALIPVAGAWIGGGISFLLLALISPMKALMFLLYLAVLQQLENNLIYPRVVGSSIGLPGLWVIFAVTVGGGLFGLPGIMLSVPTMSVIYTLIKDDVRFRGKKN